jgi:regulator of RNase E activity RraA
VLKVVAVNSEPVRGLCSIDVSPGDYVIGDVNGVVVLPRALAEKVLPLMEKQVAADSKMAVEIAKGRTFTEASKKFRL